MKNFKTRLMATFLAALLFVSIFAILPPDTGFAATPASALTLPRLGSVDSRDVIYQIITDRFFDGDPSNNFPDGFDPALFGGTDSDRKLFQGGDWQGIIQKIPYLQGMGITAVWMSAPVHNRMTEIRDYQPGGGVDIWTSFHGFHARNFFVPNPHFGTMTDFLEMRDALHDAGIKLVLDFVTNHTSRWQNPTTGFSPEDGRLYEPDRRSDGSFALDADGLPYDYNGDGIVENLVADPHNDILGWFHGLGDRGGDSTRFGFRHRDLASLADFSHENGMVVQYLEEALLFWTEFGVNGIRHDATLHMNLAFAKGLKDAVNTSNTITHFGEFFIGRPDPKYAEFASFPCRTGINNLDFEFYRAAKSTFGHFSTPMSDFANMLMYTQEDYAFPNQTVTFIDNHDVTRFGYVQRRQSVFDAAIAVLMTSRGIPIIYYGTEHYVNPGYHNDNEGRVFMPVATGFGTDTTAYQLIGELAGLRRENDAIAFGLTNILYASNDVMVFERQFFDDVVVIAVNRQPDRSYTVVPQLHTNLPNGQFDDFLYGRLLGDGITVTNGRLSSFHLHGAEVSIWQYNAVPSATPQIGDIISTMGRVGNTVYIYGDGLGGNVTVRFGNVIVPVIYNYDRMIITEVPAGAIPGPNYVTVTRGGHTSNPIVYRVLSGDQNQIIFHVEANTNWGENIYIVGNIPELGSWDPNRATEAMMNPHHPHWFLPASVPRDTVIEFKFIRRDAAGNVRWEGGPNRIIRSAPGSTDTLDTPMFQWRW